MTPEVSELPGYEDLQLLRAGPFSSVYRARQVAFDRLVAVKVLRASVDDRGGERFRRECATTGLVSHHPNIITVLDRGLAADGQPYLTTTYQPGGSLLDRVTIAGPRPVPEAIAIVAKVAGALDAAHRAGLLHRDLEPDNILFSAFGEPVVTGFGRAAAVDEGCAPAGPAPVAGVHAAPETLEHGECTVASDIYALGSTFYVALAGHAPFEPAPGEGTLPLLLRILHDPVPPIDRDDISPLVVAVLEHALAKSPADRISTAAAFVDELHALEDALGLPPTTVVRPTRPTDEPAPAARPAPVTPHVGIPALDQEHEHPTITPPITGGRARPPMLATPLPSVEPPAEVRPRGIVVEPPAPPPVRSSKVPVIVVLAVLAVLTVLLAVVGSVLVLRRPQAADPSTAGTTVLRVPPGPAGSAGSTPSVHPPTTTSSRPIAAWAPAGTGEHVLDALEVAQQFATLRDTDHAWDAVLGRDRSLAGQTIEQLDAAYGRATASTVILIDTLEPRDLEVVRLRIGLVTHRMAGDGAVTAISCEIWSVTPTTGAVNTGTPTAHILDPGSPGSQDPATLATKVRTQCATRP